MDTTTGPARKNLRASITKKYEERVAATMEKIDPHRAKAHELLRDIDNFELEEVDGTFTAPDHHANEVKVAYMDAPLLTLRELMPGSTGEGDEDGKLDQSFRADKIEFMVMQRTRIKPKLTKSSSMLPT